MSQAIEVILFDVGGVLCELGEDPVPMDWIPGDRRFSLDDWFHSDMALDFEKGQISAEQLASAFKQDLHIKQSVEEILSHFDAWLVGPYTGTMDLLECIPDRYRMAILSNTNALHWPKISQGFGLEPYFERIFSSHLLGMAKPDPDIFRQVSDMLRVDAGQVLFLDDNESNVRSATSVGMDSIKVQGIDEVRRALELRGVIAMGGPGRPHWGPKRL